jgi:hypothetical protein
VRSSNTPPSSSKKWIFQGLENRSRKVPMLGTKRSRLWKLGVGVFANEGFNEFDNLLLLTAREF